MLAERVAVDDELLGLPRAGNLVNVCRRKNSSRTLDALSGTGGLLVGCTIQEISELVDGEVVGDGSQLINAARPLIEARAGDITFVEDERYLPRFDACGATAAIVSMTMPANGKPMIRVREPRAAFTAVYLRLHGRPNVAFSGIHPTAWVDPTATVAPDAAIGPHASIGAGCIVGARSRLHAGASLGDGCTLGEDVVLFAHVSVYEGCVIRNRVVIHANSVIGADGFGYRQQQGRHVKVPQIGIVEIEDDVEIGACTTIDRATFGTTRIGQGSKIDNLVQIGHNCQIGKHNILCSQVGIAGSVSTGDYVIMAGQVGVADHVEIGTRAQVGPQSGVPKDIPADERFWGTPARPGREQMRMLTAFMKLPELQTELRKIKRHLHLNEVDE